MVGQLKENLAAAPLVALLMTAVLLLSSWCLTAASASAGQWRRTMGVDEGVPGAVGASGADRPLFLLGNFRRVVKTAAGEVKVVTGRRWKADPNPMHVGIISMEPNTLMIPQYIDSNLIFFIREGEASVGWIHEDEMVEKKHKSGDINAIPAGSAFYILNTGSGRRLHIICSIDSSESLAWNSYQSFFIGGGSNPTSVLAGFGVATLTAALNVSTDDLSCMMKSQAGGPIIYVEHPQNLLSSFARSTQQTSTSARKELRTDGGDGERRQGETWSWPRTFINYILGRMEEPSSGPVRSPHSYNLYNSDPSFKNHHGWSIAIDEHDYSPLKRSGMGIYLVNLTAGAMLAPHVNPTATEYGIILRGSGTIQVVFPNGTAAMNADVSEGDVFWIPRYFPFCQIASHGGPLEFFGFTTSSRRNRPQFLAGASSLLRSMVGPELAAAFGMSEGQLERIVKAQTESVILPAWSSPEEPLAIRNVAAAAA